MKVLGLASQHEAVLRGDADEADHSDDRADVPGLAVEPQSVVIGNEGHVRGLIALADSVRSAARRVLFRGESVL